MMQQRISKKLIVLILVCFLIDCIYAEQILIKVGGGGPDNLKFVPQNVTAKKGDNIVWKFMGGNHNVVESQGVASCEIEENRSFGSLTDPPTKYYNMTIDKDKEVITYMCSVGSHCTAGMWGIIYVGGTEPPSFVKPHNKDNSNVDTNDSTMDNNAGKIAGIVIGSIIGFAIVIAIGFLVAKRYTRQRTVPTIEGIKRIDDKSEDTDQAKKDHQVQLENIQTV